MLCHRRLPRGGHRLRREAEARVRPRASVNEPLLRVTWTDPITTRHAYLVIDRLIGGISGGGTRVREGCTLAEVERLAQTMTLKNGGLDLPVGGAKCGLDIDPHDAETHGMLVRFVRSLRPIFETYMGTGEDMGTSQDQLVKVFVEAGVGTTFKAIINASSDPDLVRRRAAEGFNVQLDGGRRGGPGGAVPPRPEPRRDPRLDPGLRLHGRLDRPLPGRKGREDRGHRRCGGDDRKPRRARRRALPCGSQRAWRGRPRRRRTWRPPAGARGVAAGRRRGLDPGRRGRHHPRGQLRPGHRGAGGGSGQPADHRRRDRRPDRARRPRHPGLHRQRGHQRLGLVGPAGDGGAGGGRRLREDLGNDAPDGRGDAGALSPGGHLPARRGRAGCAGQFRPAPGGGRRPGLEAGDAAALSRRNAEPDRRLPAMTPFAGR
ncbi:MAG: hypothetical protein E6J29_03095 [Chloroflexi bacterium]|nr:MAG: hypothetical protein E6J29_03095 [Chloroflexota bacterium]